MSRRASPRGPSPGRHPGRRGGRRCALRRRRCSRLPESVLLLVGQPMFDSTLWTNDRCGRVASGGIPAGRLPHGQGFGRSGLGLSELEAGLGDRWALPLGGETCSSLPSRAGCARAGAAAGLGEGLAGDELPGDDPGAATASRANAQDRSRRREGCWVVFIAMSLRLSEPAEPAMPRVAAHREGRSGPPAAMSRRIRPYSEGRTPEAHKARASQAASRASRASRWASQTSGWKKNSARTSPARPPQKRSRRRTWASSWARTGRITAIDRGSRSIATGSRIAGRNAPTSIGRATASPVLNSGTLRRPRTRARSAAASRRSGQSIGRQDRRRRVTASHSLPARIAAPPTPASQSTSTTQAGLGR